MKGRLYNLVKNKEEIESSEIFNSMLERVESTGGVQIDGKNLLADSVYAKHIVAGEITSDLIHAGAITADKIHSGAITTEKLDADAITADKIKAGSITTEELATDAVTADKIKAGTITADELSADAITADMINAGDLDVKNIRLVSGLTEILSVNQAGEVKLNVTSLNINTVDLESELNNKATQEELKNIELTPGPEGPPGKDGESGRAVTSTKAFYYLSNSPTSLVGGSWQTETPTINEGQYVWNKIVTSYSSGSDTESSPVMITGSKGPAGSDGSPGQGIESITQEFYLSNSKTTQTGGRWQSSQPDWEKGKYLWTRSVITYKNPTEVKRDNPIVSTEWEAAKEVKEELDFEIRGIKNSFAMGLTDGQKIIAGITGDPNGTRITGKDITLDGKVNFTDEAFIPSANIKGLTADKITTGILKSNDLANDFYLNLNTGYIRMRNANIEGNITAGSIKSGTIDVERIANLSIGTAKIANGAITNAKISDLSADKIKAGVIKSIDSKSSFELNLRTGKVTMFDAYFEQGEVGGHTVDLYGFNSNYIDSPSYSTSISNARSIGHYGNTFISLSKGSSYIFEVDDNGKLKADGGVDTSNISASSLNASGSIYAGAGIEVNSHITPRYSGYEDLGSSSRKFRTGHINTVRTDSLNSSSGGALKINSSNTIEFGNNLKPTSHNQYALGNAGYRWSAVYGVLGSFNTSSDSRFKEEQKDVPKELVEFFAKEVKPKQFVADGKTHYGYIAQDVERALHKYATSVKNIKSTKELKDFVNNHHMLQQGESYKSLVYDEVHSVKIAQQENELERLKEELKLKDAQLEDQDKRIKRLEDLIIST